MHRLTMEQILDMLGKIGGTVTTMFFAVWVWADIEILLKVVTAMFAVSAASFTMVSCTYTIKRHRAELRRMAESEPKPEVK